MCTADNFKEKCPALLRGIKSKMGRIIAFIGNFGSGKTELAINTALKLKEENDSVALVDVDLINPYFKSSFRKKSLNEKGIRVVGPTEIGTLLPETVSMFDDSEVCTVLDVGGDPVGATVLGQYALQFSKVNEMEVLYVVNFCRPMTDTVDKVITMMEEIEQRGRISITCLVNNTNLAAETTAQDLRDGQEKMQELSRRTGLNIKWVCGRRNVVEEYKNKYGNEGGKLITIDIFMREDWMDIK